MTVELVTVSVGLASAFLGVGGAILAFGRREGKRDQVIESHGSRLDYHAKKIEECLKERERVTVLEQSLIHMRGALDEVRSDVKEIKAAFSAKCRQCERG